MGFQTNKSNYHYFSIYLTTSEKNWPSAHMLSCAYQYAKEDVYEKEEKIALVLPNMTRKEWNDRAKEDFFGKWNKMCLPLFANEDGIDISDIQTVASKGFKMIMILGIEGINGTNTYKKLQQLAAISWLYDCDVRVSFDKPFDKKVKVEESEFYFSDLVRLVIDDPKDENTYQYIDYVPESITMKRVPAKKSTK